MMDPQITQIHADFPNLPLAPPLQGRARVELNLRNLWITAGLGAGSKGSR